MTSYLLVADLDAADGEWRLEMLEAEQRRLGAARHELQTTHITQRCMHTKHALLLLL